MATEVYAVPEKFRDDFPTSDINAFWKVVTPPPGAGWSIDWATPSALRMIAGATVGEMAIRSTRGFKAPFGVQWLPLAAQLISQRVANQEIILAVTTEDGKDVAAWVFDGTSAVVGKTRSGNGGVLATDVTRSIIDTGSNSCLSEMEIFPNEVYWHTRIADDPSARAVSYVRQRRVPDPNTTLFIEIRIRNLAATTTGTVLALDGVTVQDINELPVEITGGRGGGAASQGVPVVSAGGAQIPVVNTNANSLPIGTDNTLNNAALAASAVFTQSASVDIGSDATRRPNRERLVVKADAAALGGVASLVLQESTDGATYREVYRSPIPVDSSAHSYDVPIRTRYRRWIVGNGATAMTNLFIQSRLLQFDGPTDQHENLEIPLTSAAGQALAASAGVTFATIDLGSNHMWDKVRFLVSSDAASAGGGVVVQQSMDNSFWFGPGQTPNSVAANGSSLIEQQIVGRYIRLYYGNGAAAATVLRVIAALVSL